MRISQLNTLTATPNKKVLSTNSAKNTNAPLIFFQETD